MNANADLAAFRLAQVYLVSAAFGHRGNPLERPTNEPIPPQTFSIGLTYADLNDGAAAQVVVRIDTDANDAAALYDFSIEMAAIAEFKPESNVPKFTPPELAKILATMVYPFIREAVANITSRGRFGPIWLNPFNVAAAMQDAPVIPQPEPTSP
jgi:preprotein translocase subunit SecB